MTMDICSREECTGCSACENICPINCITFAEDDNRQPYPVINKDICTECNLCKKTCPINGNTDFSTPKKAYAVWSIDSSDRHTSSSGGLAAVLYRHILAKGGIGFGVDFDEQWNLNYFGAENLNQALKFKGSKYVMGSINNQFREMLSHLENEKNVLFVGTPCHVDGLKHYLRKDYLNLYTVDLICHGVPPNTLLKEHINYIENKEKTKYDKLIFRKENQYCFNLYKDEKLNHSVNGSCDTYLCGFIKGLFYRNSCYNCSYARNERVSDITIGDFWGLGRKLPFNQPVRGAVSVALINSKRGERLLDECRKHLFIEERPIEEAIEGNTQLSSPSVKHPKTAQFWSDYKISGFEKAAKAALKPELREGRKNYRNAKIRMKLRKIYRIVFLKKD